MKKVISIGEALIDFIPQEKGVALKGVSNFLRVAGGAPLNVAAAVSKLGGKSQMITKLGIDGFGDHILEEVKPLGVDVSKVLRTKEANTALAFVSLKEDGERDFSFYRNPSADMLLNASEIEEEVFSEGGILHFCSVSLIDAPIKDAHRKAIEFAKKHNCLISFDPNVRLPLWETPEACREAILEFLPFANIVKISDEELEFITGIADETEALNFLLQGDVEVIIYTKGTNGAEFITKERKVFSPSFKVQAQDTTGAGDSFIGSFLYQVAEGDNTLESLVNLPEDKVKEILTFSNATAALTVCKRGAIGALPTKEEVLALAQGR
ncbi:MAG: carbohydrate kinase [Clostridium celatum]|uniref:carbohydrate kinase family protein n=1 Tax=uncultured Clostridium sp. TaxID=59620 RepID=UPI0025D2FCF6|nr:carbohydrate kinase [uncultured Clostridium sp.]MDU4884839.1 carbohydrate kinase [Clostridium celatum]MDU5261839.1 carbohydrate kinase [Clostridium celatum]MDU7078066.1 carbohydrate kinase [Clostridium celatum]